MLINQLTTELKRAITKTNILLWVSIIVLLPTISFLTMTKGYVFYDSIELFHSIISVIIPLLFPVLTIIIYLPNFLHEQKNNFISYARTRIPLQTYLLSKGLINVFFTSFITFFMIFLSFIFALYVEPKIGIIQYNNVTLNQSEVTFSQLLSTGVIPYIFVYSLWVSMNAIVYSSIAFILLLIIRSHFIALSVPFLFYHVFNFISGVLGEPRFSPISTIFPFNIEQQPLWTVLVPFTFLFLSLIILLLVAMRKKDDWVI
jgi:hypothetical protein